MGSQCWSGDESGLPTHSRTSMPQGAFIEPQTYNQLVALCTCIHSARWLTQQCAPIFCSSHELCPPGGYTCHHETLTNRRTRGKLVITNESLVFSKAGGIPEMHDITYEV